MITDRDTRTSRDNVYNMVTPACGIEDRSAVPEENQLMLPFLSLVTEAEMGATPL